MLYNKTKLYLKICLKFVCSKISVSVYVLPKWALWFLFKWSDLIITGLAYFFSSSTFNICVAHNFLQTMVMFILYNNFYKPMWLVYPRLLISCQLVVDCRSQRLSPFQLIVTSNPKSTSALAITCNHCCITNPVWNSKSF